MAKRKQIVPKPAYAVMTVSAPVNQASKLLSKAVERAMSGAVEKALADGLDALIDADEIRSRILKAREDIKRLWPIMTEAQRNQAAGNG